jgi:lysophospholipase L1-like esterase
MQGPAALRRPAVNDAAGNIGRMIDAGRRLGLEVAVAEVLPWNGGYPEAAPYIKRLNRLIDLTARLKGVPVVRFAGALAKPGNRDLMRSRLTADGAHPSIAGYRRLGALVAARFGRGG